MEASIVQETGNDAWARDHEIGHAERSRKQIRRKFCHQLYVTLFHVLPNWGGEAEGGALMEKPYSHHVMSAH